MIESGVADALCPHCDRDDPILRQFREVGRLSARLFCTGPASEDEFSRAVGHLEVLPLPAAITMSTPEGYAHYAVYPEMYLDAAAQFAREFRPSNAVVIGIRSIGTSLSSVVAAALERTECAVHSMTVRPRGHAFDRSLVLSPDLERDLRQRAGGYF